MKKFKLLLTILIVLTSSNIWAGPEHDHGAPTFQAPKGGILKSTHTTHFELVKNQNTVSLYAYDQEGRGLPTKDFKLTTDLELPRKKTAPITLNDKSTHWEATIDSQGTHRFTLKITIDDGKEKDDVKFTVENN